MKKKFVGGGGGERREVMICDTMQTKIKIILLWSPAKKNLRRENRSPPARYLVKKNTDTFLKLWVFKVLKHSLVIESLSTYMLTFNLSKLVYFVSIFKIL